MQTLNPSEPQSPSSLHVSEVPSVAVVVCRYRHGGLGGLLRLAAIRGDVGRHVAQLGRRPVRRTPVLRRRTSRVVSLAFPLLQMGTIFDQWLSFRLS